METEELFFDKQTSTDPWFPMLQEKKKEKENTKQTPDHLAGEDEPTINSTSTVSNIQSS